MRSPAGSSLIFLAVFGISVSAAAETRRYAMDDLQALAKARRWSELLEHMEDIRPKARDARWKALLLQAAKGWLAHPTIAANALAASRTAEALLRRHPSLASDAALMKKRAQVGLKAHAHCLTRRYWARDCERSLRSFVAQKGTLPETAHAAGKLVRRHMVAHLAVFYFARGVRAKSAGDKKKISARCSDKDLFSAVLSALGHLRASPTAIADAKVVALGPCWPQLKDKLIGALPENPRAQHHLCKELLARKVLSGVRRRKCARLLKR